MREQLDDIVVDSGIFSPHLTGDRVEPLGNDVVGQDRYAGDDLVMEDGGVEGGKNENRLLGRGRKVGPPGLALFVTLVLQAKPYFQGWRQFVASFLRILYVRLGFQHIVNVLKQVAEYRKKMQSKYVAAAAVLGAGYLYNQHQKQKQNKHKARRVAIVGSGIAGAAAAWSLNKAGVDVVLYEKKPKVGGNAKSMTWDVDGKKVETGLAVFAWPAQLFHNYNAIVDELDIETEDHDTRFFVAEKQRDGNVECVFAHGKDGWEPKPWLKQDLERWDRMCAFIKRVNGVLQPSESPSFYRMSFLNPLNMLPLRTLCRVWGISDRFWDYVFVPIHTSTFLEIEMDTLPASMAEVLNDIVPFTKTPNMRCWKTHAYDAVVKMLKNIPQENIKTSCAVETVQYIPSRTNPGQFDIRVQDEDDHVETFDSIIYACSAQAMNRILHGKGEPVPGQVVLPNSANGLNNHPTMWKWKAWLLNWMETTLLSNTLYTTDRDKTFERGVVHSDAKAVLPANYEGEILDAYCNYIEVDAKNPRNLENSFVISSWAPSTQTPEVRGKLPMLVTYNAEKKLENVKTEWVSTSREAHPCLTTFQMASSVLLWPFLQGARNNQTYFCGSAVLPGNGHDLSFLSGLICAAELGAPYPFIKDKDANSDYHRMRGMMLSLWA